MGYHLTPVTIEVIKNLQITNAEEDGGEKDHLCTSNGNVVLV